MRSISRASRAPEAARAADPRDTARAARPLHMNGVQFVSVRFGQNARNSGELNIKNPRHNTAYVWGVMCVG